MTTTSRIVAEQLIPTAVEERWTTRAFADRVGCDRTTAARILADRLGQVRRETDRVIVGLAETASCTLEQTATRQIARLEALNAKALEEWTAADYALERQALSILRQVVSLARGGPAAGERQEADTPMGSDAAARAQGSLVRLEDGLVPDASERPKGPFCANADSMALDLLR
jgi:hypothetical protein